MARGIFRGGAWTLAVALQVQQLGDVGLVALQHVGS